MKPTKFQTSEFLRESNAIEGVYSVKALEDAKKAWGFAYKERKRIKSLDYVLTIHKLLLRRLNKNIAGKLRKCPVYIGGEKKDNYENLDKQVLEWLFQAYITDFENQRKGSLYDRDDFSRAAHISFENIHPFEDGNGRVGRILYNIHRLNLGLPLHIIHEGEEQQNYYQWFKHEKDVDWIIKNFEKYEKWNNEV